MNRSILLPITLWLVSAADGASILAVLPTPAASHHVMFQSVLKTLAEAGHHVTSYSPFPLDQPVLNYTEIQIENVLKLKEFKAARLAIEFQSMTHRLCFDICYTVFELIYDLMSRSPELQRLLKSSDKFDLVMIEHSCGNDHLTILGHIFNAPVIGMQAFMTNDVLNSLSGNSLSLSFLPDICTAHPNRMGFADRLSNAVDSVQRLYNQYYHHLPEVENMMRRSFPDMPPLLEMIRKVSLTLVNDHMTAEYAFPRTPNIVPVGGVHIRTPGKLPDDIQKFMDESEEGVIFFSMGTYVPDELQTKEYFDLYIDAFSRLKQRVLWKTRKTDFDSLPTNVLTKPWMPQQGILNHPKCVLFVTHGGQHSHLETVHYGVPVVVIPQFYDQFRNARLLEDKGCGLTLYEEDVTKHSLIKTIQTVIGDKRYRRNMARLSAVFRDRPLSAARTVVYWTEYVVRHAGAPHLRPIAAIMPWYQRASLDVAAAFILMIFAVLITFYCLSRFLWNCISTDRNTRRSKKFD